LLKLKNENGMKEKKFVKVDYESIKKEVEADPEGMVALANRAAAGDPKLKLEDVAKAYYACSYFKGFCRPDSTMELHKLSSMGKYDELLEKLNEELALEPLWLGGLMQKIEVCRTVGDIGELMQLDEVIQHLLVAISKTGDGTKEHPYYVTSVDDEYILLRNLLCMEPLGQGLMGHCDVMKVETLHGEKRDVWFEISRVLEIERGLS
jgi:hypothetical protein